MKSTEIAKKEKVNIFVRNGVLGHYSYSYQYQTCFDDGGVGHDSGWSQTLSAPITGMIRTDKGAVRRAKEMIDERDGKHPCNGTFCDNKGHYKLMRVFFDPLPIKEINLWPIADDE